MTLVDIDPGDQVGCEVDDLLELLGLELFFGLDAGEQVCQPASGTAQIPDVHHWRSELDVAHALAAHLATRHFDTTALADDALKAHPLVLTAVALPVACWSEDLLAEESVLFRTQRAVVDRFGFLHLTVGPLFDLVGSCQTDLQLVKHVYVKHRSLASSRVVSF